MLCVMASPALTIYRMLLGLIVVLCLVFLGGTAYWFFFHRGDEPIAVLGAQSAPETQEFAEAHIFTGIGRLRLSTAGPQSAMVILTITFPYIPTDRAFAEELAARIGDFRTIAGDYFLSFNIEELLVKDEEEIKAELLELFNQVLRLGRIQILFFNDFLLFD